MNQFPRSLCLGLLALVFCLLAPVLPAAEPAPADQAWKELRKAATPPTPPREWSTRKPADEELAAFNRERAGKALAAADRARSFYTEHAADRRSAEARKLEYDLLSAVVQLGDPSVTDRMMALQDALVSDPALDPDQRLSMVLIAAKGALQATGEDRIAGMLKAKGIFLKALERFPSRSEPAAYLLQLAEMLLAYDQAEGAREILNRLDREGIDEEVRAQARTQLNRFERLGKPVEIAFTAIDGRKVDVAALKGRVLSVSSSPAPDDPRYPAMLGELAAIFDQCQQGGAVTFVYSTRVICGRLPE